MPRPRRWWRKPWPRPRGRRRRGRRGAAGGGGGRGGAGGEEALASAARAQKEWAALRGVERGRVLRRAADLIRERNRDLSVIETHDTGKPLSETLVADASSAADALEYFGGL